VVIRAAIVPQQQQQQQQQRSTFQTIAILHLLTPPS